MPRQSSLPDFLVLSRGKWDADKSPEEIQRVIDALYVWHDRLVQEGRLKPGQRLATQTKLVSRSGVMDGPYAEAKEVIGGYWFFRAADLQEAVALASQNPSLACGLAFEIRPIESERANAFKLTNETPGPESR
ncbi:MAG: YciI family protein [Pseudomonadota bacterium]